MEKINYTRKIINIMTVLFAIMILTNSSLLVFDAYGKKNKSEDVALIDLNATDLLNKLNTTGAYNISIEKDTYKIEVIKDFLISEELEKESQTYFFRGKVQNYPNSTVRLTISKTGFIGGYIDTGIKCYTIDTSINKKDKNIYTLYMSNTQYVPEMNNNKRSSISNITGNISDTANTNSSVDLSKNSNLTIDENNSKLVEIKTISPGTTITEWNEIYYVCRIGVFWDYTWNDTYGLSSMSQAYSMIYQVNEIFMRDVKIKFYISQAEYAEESETEWSYNSIESFTDSFKVWCENEEKMDEGSNKEDMKNIWKLDRAIVFVDPQHVTFVPGNSHRNFSVVTNIGNPETRVTTTAHELGHTFGGNHDYYTTIQGEVTIMFEYVRPPDESINQFSDGNVLCMNAYAMELRWRAEIYDGEKSSYAAPMYGNIRLNYFESFYLLIDDISYTAIFNYCIANLNPYAVTFELIFFGCRDSLERTLDFGAIYDYTLYGSLGVHGERTFTYANTYTVWPAYRINGNYGKYKWQASKLPVIGSSVHISSSSTYSHPHLEFRSIKIFGPAPWYEDTIKIGQSILIQFNIKNINTSVDYLDFVAGGPVFTKLIDPDGNNEDFGHIAMRIHKNGNFTYRAWAELDQLGYWSINPCYWWDDVWHDASEYDFTIVVKPN